MSQTRIVIKHIRISCYCAPKICNDIPLFLPIKLTTWRMPPAPLSRHSRHSALYKSLWMNEWMLGSVLRFGGHRVRSGKGRRDTVLPSIHLLVSLYVINITDRRRRLRRQFHHIRRRSFDLAGRQHRRRRCFCRRRRRLRRRCRSGCAATTESCSPSSVGAGRWRTTSRPASASSWWWWPALSSRLWSGTGS